MTVFLDGKWFQLNWRKTELKDFPDDITLLDVHLLNEKVLKPILGIKNIRTDPRIGYADDTETIADLEKACPTEGVVFCLFPVEPDDLQAVADSEGTMPPKSTFFIPRMKNGLLVYEF
ncbi:MAG: DUF1015 domain-containing protein [Saprospiraceae bacterium]|nr:DUF1015 domain-containing protein [Saprospiraceae bacterium]